MARQLSVYCSAAVTLFLALHWPSRDALAGRESPMRITGMVDASLPLYGDQTSTTSAQSKTVQLRLFTINRGQMDAFVSAWLRGVYPLRLKHGFNIEGAWIIRERNQFMWVLSYEGPETFAAKDSAYYSSEARQKLDPDPVQYIANVERWIVTPVVAGP